MNRFLNNYHQLNYKFHGKLNNVSSLYIFYMKKNNIFDILYHSELKHSFISIKNMYYYQGRFYIKQYYIKNFGKL